MRNSNFNDKRVIVLGDVMLDRYYEGEVNRISPEAPVPVVSVDKVQSRLGGAANVALNLERLGAKVTLIGLVGDDEAGVELQQAVGVSRISSHLIVRDDIKTTVKLRVQNNIQQLIRLDFESSLGHDAYVNQLISALQSCLDGADCLILSDYAKGVLINPQPFIQAAIKAGVPVFIDPKNEDFSVYCGATLIKPNWREFTRATQFVADAHNYISHAQALIAKHDIEHILVTRGKHGMTLVNPAGSYHAEANAREVFDVTGAGDTVTAVLALCWMVGYTPEESVDIANVAAGLVVCKAGAANITQSELRLALHRHFMPDRAILNEADCKIILAQERDLGKRLVMTNGCFDILHLGHIRYLQQAASMGDRLLVAVNDDASVARLKGADRPIHTLVDRCQMLSALGCVDWVIPFSEDTPERLINEILPDVLVKAGDYAVSDIAGHQAVLNNGGEVKICDFIEGYSTTQFIKQLKGETL